MQWLTLESVEFLHVQRVADSSATTRACQARRGSCSKVPGRFVRSDPRLDGMHAPGEAPLVGLTPSQSVGVGKCKVGYKLGLLQSYGVSQKNQRTLELYRFLSPVRRLRLLDDGHAWSLAAERGAPRRRLSRKGVPTTGPEHPTACVLEHRSRTDVRFKSNPIAARHKCPEILAYCFSPYPQLRGYCLQPAAIGPFPDGPPKLPKGTGLSRRGRFRRGVG